MKRVYLSFPIRGQEDTVFERNDIYKKWASKQFPGYEIYSPIDENHIGEKELKTHTDISETARYMGKDIEAVILSDIVVLFPGHENSNGCKVEKFTAQTYGKIVEEYDYYLTDDLLFKVMFRYASRHKEDTEIVSKLNDDIIELRKAYHKRRDSNGKARIELYLIADEIRDGDKF